MAKHTSAAVEKSLYSILVTRIPAIKTELHTIGDTSCGFKVAAFFAAYTKAQIKSKNYTELKKCFQVADELLRLSDTSRQAIGNVYLFSLLRYLDVDEKVRHAMPLHLNKLYQKMLASSGT